MYILCDIFDEPQYEVREGGIAFVKSVRLEDKTDNISCGQMLTQIEVPQMTLGSP